MSTQDPIERFRRVYERAVATGMENPNAMTLSTVDAEGQPSSRQVLLKSFDHRGFVFYTNLESRKGRELAGNSKVSLNFYWRELERQVTVRGTAEPVGEDEADAYFASRDRGSQLGAWASRQSRPLKHRGELMAAVAQLEARFLGGPVPRPPHWSGFRVVPSTIELWEAGAFRLHKRTVFHRDGDGWRSELLFP